MSLVITTLRWILSLWPGPPSAHFGTQELAILFLDERSFHHLIRKLQLWPIGGLTGPQCAGDPVVGWEEVTSPLGPHVVPTSYGESVRKPSRNTEIVPSPVELWGDQDGEGPSCLIQGASV